MIISSSNNNNTNTTNTFFLSLTDTILCLGILDINNYQYYISFNTYLRHAQCVAHGGRSILI